MTTYNVTSPEGKKFRVTAPEGATQEQILAYAQKNMPPIAPKAQKPTMNKIGSFGMGLADMASFGFDDELRGLGRSIGNKLRGNNMGVGQGIDQLRGEQNIARESNPGTYIAGQVTGAVLPALATGGRSVLSSIKSPIARAATAGGIQGGLYGAGTGEGSPVERLDDAAKIGSFGALGGAGIAYGLSLLGRGVGGAASKLAGKIDDIQNPSPPIPPATQKVIDKLRADFPDDAEYAKALAGMADNGTLAEIGPQGGQIQRLTRGSAQYPSGEKVIAENITDRMSGASQRIKQSIKDYISPNNDFYGTIDSITQKGQAKARPLYEKAYESNKSVMDKEIDDILSTPIGKKALAGASNKILNDRDLVKTITPAERNQIYDEAKALGEVMIGTPTPTMAPKVGYRLRTLDYVKRSFDDQIAEARRAGLRDDARIITGLKKDFVSRLDALDKSGSYAKARATSGDYLSNTEALETGRDFMKMDSDVIGKTFKSFNEGQKESFKAGIARSVRDIIDKSPDGSDIAKRILGKEEIRNKLKAVMSPKEYDELAKSIYTEERIFKLQKFVLGNSTTTSKAVDAADLSSGAEDIIQTIATQGPRAAGIQQIAKVVSRTFSGLNDKTAGEVAKILMETDPQKKLQILSNLRSNPKGNNQIVLETFFKTNKALQAAKRTLPAETIGVGAGAVAGSASNPLKFTVRPNDYKREE